MTYYYLFKTFRRLTGSNHLAFGITSNLCTCIPWYLPQQPRFQADKASNNPVSGVGNKEQNSKIAFSSSICIILHIIFTSFIRHNTNATLYNNPVSPLIYYYILFISVYPYMRNFVDKISQRSYVYQQNFVFGSLLFRSKFGYLSSLLLRHFP